MRCSFRAGSPPAKDAPHRNVSVWVNGALAGVLTVRTTEARELSHMLERGGFIDNAHITGMPPLNSPADRARRVLSLNPVEQERFNGNEFMGLSFAQMSRSDLQGLVVWLLRNKDFIGSGSAWDMIPTRTGEAE